MSVVCCIFGGFEGVRSEFFDNFLGENGVFGFFRFRRLNFGGFLNWSVDWFAEMCGSVCDWLTAGRLSALRVPACLLTISFVDFFAGEGQIQVRAWNLVCVE